MESKTPAIASFSSFVVAVTQNLIQPCWFLKTNFEYYAILDPVRRTERKRTTGYKH